MLTPSFRSGLASEPGSTGGGAMTASLFATYPKLAALANSPYANMGTPGLATPGVKGQADGLSDEERLRAQVN